jgi:hypothetical protein
VQSRFELSGFVAFINFFKTLCGKRKLKMGSAHFILMAVEHNKGY